jgi:hypothetical protein
VGWSPISQPPHSEVAHQCDRANNLQTVGKKYANFCILVRALMEGRARSLANHQRINNKRNDLGVQSNRHLGPLRAIWSAVFPRFFEIYAYRFETELSH